MILIDAETMWKCDTCFYNRNGGCKNYCDAGEGYRPAFDKLENLSSEYRKVKYGEWIKVKDNTIMSPCYECSECGRKINTWGDPEKFAPYCHCGAKMGGEKRDDG